MPLGNVTITWDETDPADPKLVGLGAGDIRSTKTNLRGALDSEHVFPSAGGPAGIHRKGSAIAFVGAASAVSSTDTDGRLMVTSDTSRLYHVGSTNTTLMGSRFLLEFSPSGMSIQGTATPSKASQIMKLEAGQFIFPTASTSTAIYLQNAYISGQWLALAERTYDGNATFGGIPVIQASGTSQLNVFNTNAAGTFTASAGTYPVNYIAFGITAG